MSIAVINRNNAFAARASFLGAGFSKHVDIVVVTQKNLYNTCKRPMERKSGIIFQSINGSKTTPDCLDSHLVSIILLELSNMCGKV